MCSRLEESGVRARPGTSGMGGTLTRGDRSVLRPRLNWEGRAARNDQNWYHARSSELGFRASQVGGTHSAHEGRRYIKAD